ncbi:MAG: glycosyltransferase family 1 protein, partial [Microcoleus sp. SIO2G3]|nr:glycosyltransferase family 1 protein [Microcoleus sp. SIO2G3]
MNLFVLLQKHPSDTRVGLAVSYILAEVLASTCDPTFVFPQENRKIKLLRRYRQRLGRSWYDLQDPPTLGQGKNILLAIGHGPNFFLSLFSLGSLLSRFDLRIGYLLDGFDPQHLDRAVIPYLDHLFVITAEMTDRLNKQVPTHF